MGHGKVFAISFERTLTRDGLHVVSPSLSVYCPTTPSFAGDEPSAG